MENYQEVLNQSAGQAAGCSIPYPQQDVHLHKT